MLGHIQARIPITLTCVLHSIWLNPRKFAVSFITQFEYCNLILQTLTAAVIVVEVSRIEYFRGRFETPV